MPTVYIGLNVTVLVPQQCVQNADEGLTSHNDKHQFYCLCMQSTEHTTCH